MMRLAAAIATSGEVPGPRLLLSGTAAKTRLLETATAAGLRDMMNYNVVYSYGPERFPGVTMYAKTGTAETGGGRSHAWFVGFVDGDTSPLAFAVIIEDAGAGLSNASPVANAVIQAANS
jgi:peptidoglycan glycosyltransferase